MKITGLIAWGNGEPCPICGKEFEMADMDHLLSHPEAMKILHPETRAIPDYAFLERNMRAVFEDCIVIAELACDKPGNTDRPWETFSIEWLQKRLEDELKEYYSMKRTGRVDWVELKDVINIACFLYLAHKKDWIERSVKR